MERKFKVGDIVKGELGSIAIVTDGTPESKTQFCGTILFGVNQGIHCTTLYENSFEIYEYKLEFAKIIKSPIDPPAPVLTELTGMKRHNVAQAILKYRNSDDTAENLTECLDKLESILSEPEPPKWMPKEGEPVLVRDEDKGYWVAVRFTQMADGAFASKWWNGSTTTWIQCRPFDIDLIGTTDNP